MMRSPTHQLRTLALISSLALSAGSVSAANWYLHDPNPQPKSWNTLTEWWSLPEGGVNPAAMSSSDDYFTNGMQVRSPETSTAQTFPGRTLILNGGSILLKGPQVTIGSLVSHVSGISNGGAGTMIANITNFTVLGSTSLSSGGATRNLDCRIGTLSGSGDLNVHGGGTVYLNITASSRFYGRVIVASGSWNSTTAAAEPTEVVFQNAITLRGPLIVEDGNNLTLSATLTVSGLTVDNVDYAPGTYSAASLGFSGTGSIVNVPSASWYLHGSTPLGQNWSNAANWWNAPTGGNAASAVSENDVYYTNGFTLRTPETTSSAMFPGAHLQMNGGGLLVKAKSGSVLTSITKLTTSGSGGSIVNGVGNVQQVRVEHLHLDSNLNLDCSSSTRGLNVTVDRLSGTSSLTFLGRSGGTLLFNALNASGYTGNIVLAANNYGTFRVQGDIFMAGQLIVNAGHSIVLDGSLTCAGVTIGGIAKTAGTYTAAQLGAQFSGSGAITVKNRPQQLFGVNAAGLEFSSALRPKDTALTYYSEKGLTLVRVPFKWERVLDASGNLITGSGTSMAHLDSILAKANTLGLKVILDMHNYGKYNGIVIGQAGASYQQYQAAWAALATHFNASPNAHVIYAYDIMNEPNGSVIDWPVAAQYGINGVRQGDTTRFIMIEGKAYSSAKDWPNVNDGLLGAVDPQNKLIYSAHCYFANANNDQYLSYDQEGATPNRAINLIAPFVEWCKRNKVHGHVGEYGVPDSDPRWNKILHNFLQYLDDNDISGTYWAGGGFWGSYPLAIDPSQYTSPINPAYDSAQMPALGLFVQ